MKRRELEELKRKEVKYPEGKVKYTTLSLPDEFRKHVKELKSKYGTIKQVFESLMRKYLSEHPARKSDKKIHKWVYSMAIPNDLRTEIIERIPRDFTKINQAFIIAIAWYISSLED